ncbi:MAG: chemotaxis protein CheD [Candidatus Limnocylindrales bacterium]
MTTTDDPTVLIAGIGEMVLSSSPDSHLVAYGLGSCVALAAWDPRTRVGGLAHFMLPSGPANGSGPVKFIDSGLDTFLNALEAKGAAISRLVLKAAGAASMLTIGGGLAIGTRNAETIQAGLTERGLRLTAVALGGTTGRTVQLEVGDGRFLVKSLLSVTEL